MTSLLLLLATACTDSTSEDSGTTDTATAEPIAAECPTPAGSPVVTDGWEALPLAPAGDVVAFATTPADPDRVYSVSSVNGPFRSDDGGRSWSPLNPVITHVLSQPLAGLEDPDLVFHSVGELYRSRDGGQTWETTGIGDRHDTQRYVKGLTWVGTDLLAVDASGQLYRSTDGGGTFALGERIEGGRHQDFYQADDTWWNLVSEGDVVLAARHGVGVWRSDDAGETWEDVSGYRQIEVASIGLDSGRAWYGDNDGFHWSENGGESFVRLDDGAEVFVAAAATDAGVVAFTERSVWQVSGEGMTPWAVPELEGGDVLSAVGLDDGTLLMGHEQGIQRSEDQGTTWSVSEEGLLDDDLVVLLAHSQCEDLLFVGTQCESGGYMTTDGGDTLEQAPAYMHYVMVAREDPFDANALWVTSDDRVHRTRDLGGSWEIAVPNSLDVHFHGLDLDPWNPGTVLIGSVGSGTFSDDRPRVYRTDDDGYRWRDSSDGLPEGDWSVHALHFSRSTPGVVLMGSFRGGDIAHNGAPGLGMFRSTDGGMSWSSVALEGVDDVAYMAECEGRVYAGTTVGVLSSDDAGETWNPSWESTTQTLAVACAGDTVLALDQKTGLVRSDDRGESWESWDEGLTAFQTQDDQYLGGLALSPDGSTAWAALKGEGLFRRGL